LTGNNTALAKINFNKYISISAVVELWFA